MLPPNYSIAPHSLTEILHDLHTLAFAQGGRHMPQDVRGQPGGVGPARNYTPFGSSWHVYLSITTAEKPAAPRIAFGVSFQFYKV